MMSLWPNNLKHHYPLVQKAMLEISLIGCLDAPHVDNLLAINAKGYEAFC
jgi:hypothetical protein